MNQRKKFKCFRSECDLIPYGDTITGVLEDGRIHQVEPLNLTNPARIRHLKSYPLYGGLWHWEEVK